MSTLDNSSCCQEGMVDSRLDGGGDRRRRRDRVVAFRRRCCLFDLGVEFLSVFFVLSSSSGFLLQFRLRDVKKEISFSELRAGRRKQSSKTSSIPPRLRATFFCSPLSLSLSLSFFSTSSPFLFLFLSQPSASTSLALLPSRWLGASAVEALA